MFDIGFPELLIVSVVALLVIGPEKLPETVRTIAVWMGRLRRSLTNIKMELENEIGADEIRQQIHNESVMKELNDAKAELNSIVNDTNSTMTELKDSARIETNLQPSGSETKSEKNESETTESRNNEEPESPGTEPQIPTNDVDDRADRRHTESGG